MKSVPPLSIVLPVRNAMPYFGEALASIEAQAFADFEVLVQDDGSTDGSLALARETAARDPRFRVETGPPQGVVHAANRAAERARGALHVRMDADDVARPGRLGALHAFGREHAEIGLFGSRIRYFPRDELGVGMQRYEAWINAVQTDDAIRADRFVEYPLPHPSTAVRSDVFRALGGYRDGAFPEDYDFFLRAAQAGIRFGKHPDVLLDWRHGPHRATRNDPRYGLDRFRALKLAFLLPELRATGLPLAIVGAGRDGKRLARSLRDAGLEVRVFVDLRPGRTGRTVQAVPVVGPDDRSAQAGCFVLVVGGTEHRADARRVCAEAGLVEGVSMLCAQ